MGSGFHIRDLGYYRNFLRPGSLVPSYSTQHAGIVEPSRAQRDREPRRNTRHADNFRNSPCAHLADGRWFDAKEFSTATGGESRVLDRKSTRLNSSHTVISYAVFCLKKKIKKKQV